MPHTDLGPALQNTNPWYQRLSTKAYNFVRYSRPWSYVVAAQLKIPFQLIKWLLPINDIQIAPGKHPIFGYVLDKLTDEAKEQGIARKDLHFPNLRFLKGPRIFSLIVAYDDKYFKKMTDVNARAAFNLPTLLTQGPELISRIEHDRLLKPVIRERLSTNHDRLWLVAKQHCANLAKTWHTEDSVPENITQLTFEMLAHFVYNVDTLPNDFAKNLDAFEAQWQNFDQFSPVKFFPIMDKFIQTSKELVLAHAASKEDPNLPQNERDLIGDMKQYHQQHSHFTAPDNVAALISIAGNLPRSIIAMVYYILTNPEFVTIINAEKPIMIAKFRQYLAQVLEEKPTELETLLGLSDSALIDKKGGDFLAFLYKESDIFRGMFNETLRVYWTAPVLPRVNTNLFFNKIGPWGHDMDLGNGHYLPPRSVGFWPKQRKMNDADIYENPEQFNPFRDIYKKENKEQGKIQSFGHPGSMRRCPAQKLSEHMFLATLWQLTGNWQFEMTAEHKALATKLPSIRDTHHLDLLGVNARIKAKVQPRKAQEQESETRIEPPFFPSQKGLRFY